MRSSIFALFAALFILGFSGCATTSAPSAAPKAKETKPAAGVGANNGKPGSGAPMLPVEAPLAEGEYRLAIESTPSDAMVVVNGIPVGKTPRTIELSGTPRGFFHDQVSVKVRFLATDATHPSQTVEELLTPLDRIPATVKFTPAGTTRVAR